MKLIDTKIFVGFDTETSGVDTDTDRIITAALVYRSKGVDQPCLFSMNPGVPIENSHIHGITDSMVQNFGNPIVELAGVRDAIRDAWVHDMVLVAHNVCYDLSILNSNLRHYDLEPLEIKGPILDTMVLYRIVNNTKKASLKVAAKKYGIVNENAHSADSDVKTTLDLLDKMIASSVRLQESDLRDLYTLQRRAHRAWAQEMQEYFRRIGKSDIVDGSWPVKES